MIKTHNLTKIFYTNWLLKKEPVRALDNVNMNIKKGQMVILLGPNGAGKTTLIKLLSGLMLPTSGEAYIDGVCSKDINSIKDVVGVVIPDERSFYGRLTGRENLMFFGSLRNKSASFVKKRIDELVEQFKMHPFIDKRYHFYSTGTKQKMMIMRCLLHNPSAIFLDEPTKGLDPIAADEFRRYVKLELVKQHAKTVIFTTHQLEEARQLEGSVMIISKGKIHILGEGFEGDLLERFVNIVESE